MTPRVLTMLALTALLAAACAPRTTSVTHVERPDPGPRAQATSPIATPAGYYPLETGLTWRYLIEGDALSGAPIETRSVGPTTLDGQLTHRLRTTGRGLDVTRYYHLNATGLHLVREDRPGAIIQYAPPMLVLPSQQHLTPGARWGGSTIAHVTFPDAPQTHQRHTISVQYTNHITDHRQVTTPAGTHEAFVITTEATDPTSAAPKRYERWFVPYIGELRTPDGLLLTDATLQ